MAKKVKDKYGNFIKLDSRGVPIKNRHALKCCFIFFAVFFLVIGLGIATTFFVGDYFLKNHLGVDKGIEDCLNEYFSFKNYKKFEKKQLKNIYKEEDANEFIDSLNDALFLENLSAKQIKNIINRLVEYVLEKDDNANISSINYLLEESKSLLPEDIIIELLEKNLSRTKIANYEDGTAEEYFVSVSDKGLAAFLNNIVLNTVLNNPKLLQTLEKELNSSLKGFNISLEGIDFKDFIQIKQINFYANGLDEEKQVGIKVITQTNIKKFSSNILNKLSGDNLLGSKASGLAKFGANFFVAMSKGIINTILPKKLYISIDMPIMQEKSPTISLNEWKGQLDELAETIPDLKSVTKHFKQGGSIYKTFESINDIVPINKSIQIKENSGSITVDMVGVLLELTKVNYDENGEKKPIEKQVTSNDLYLALKAFVGADIEAVMEQKQQYDYTRFEFVKENGKYVFDENGIPFMRLSQQPVREIELIHSEYEEALLTAFSKSYGLVEGTTFDQLFNLISGEGSESDFIALFDSNKIKEIAKGEAFGAIITPKMLSAILSKYSERFLSNEEVDIKLRYLTMFDQIVDNKKHNLVEIGIEIGLQSLYKVGEEEFLSKVLAAIVPKSILIGVKMDITPNLAQDEYLGLELFVDRLSYDETKKIIKLVNNLGIGNINGSAENLEGYLQEMLLPVRNIINQMATALPGLSLGESGIIAPDVYHALAGILNKTASKEIMPEELEDCIKFLLSYKEMGSRIKDLEGLINELNYYYALKLDSQSNKPLKDLFDSLNITGGNTEISDIIDIDGLKTLIFLDKAASELSPAFTGEMFAALIYQFIDTVSDTNNLAKFLPRDSIANIKFFTNSGRNMMSLTVILDIQVLLSYGGQSEIIDFLSSLIGKVAITVVLDISPTEDGKLPIEVILNGDDVIAAEKTQNLFDLLDKLIGDFSDSMLDSLASTLDNTVRQIFISMHEMGLSTTVNDNKLLFSDLFTVLDSALGAENKIGANNLKKVLEEIYINPADTENNYWLEKDNIVATSKEQEINKVINQIDFEDLTKGLVIEIKDAAIAGMLEHEAADKFNGVISAIFILAQKDNSLQADSLRNWLKGFDGLDYNQKDYMIIKVRIDISELGKIDVASAINLLPEKMYVTLLFELNGNSPTYKWFRINNMSQSEQQNLLKFIGKTSEIEDILGGSGQDNIGGKFFESLTSTVLGFVDSALHNEFDSLAAMLGLTLNINYSYDASAGGFGRMLVTFSFSNKK